jgi:tmRNA-binding protein
MSVKCSANTIVELRGGYHSIPLESKTDEERQFFENYIAECESEVARFQGLLNKVVPHKTKSQSLQAVERATRLQLHKKEIDKYNGMIQAQLFRLLSFETQVHK